MAEARFISCTDCAEKLTAPSDDLSPEDRTTLEEHIAPCSAYSHLHAEDRRLSRLIRDLPAPKFSTGLPQKLLQMWQGQSDFSSENSPSADSSDSGRPWRAPPTVLVVDDSPIIRHMVKMILQREHIRVITADDGLSALTAVADEMPALILLDIQLQRMDGYHICQIIHKNLQFRQIPIIMLGGKDGLFDKMRARFAGSTGYITKPFDAEELLQIVKAHLVGWC